MLFSTIVFAWHALGIFGVGWKKKFSPKITLRQWHRQGGQGGGGRLPPNVEKDGPRNSSKFDEKIGGGGVGIHLRCEKIINTKYF